MLVFPLVAVRVTDFVDWTDETVAEKLADSAFAEIVTLAGTLTEESLLLSVTAVPPVGEATFKDTVQVSDPGLVTVLCAQLIPERPGDPVPLRLMLMVPVSDVVERASSPLMATAAGGAN